MVQNSNGKSKLTLEDWKQWPIWYMDWDVELYYPITDFEKFSEYVGDDQVKVQYTAPNGVKMNGYVSDVFCSLFYIEIFIEDEEIGFNIHMSLTSIAEEQLNKIRKHFPKGTFKDLHDLFPIKFKTDVNLDWWKEVEGTFDIFRDNRGRMLAVGGELIPEDRKYLEERIKQCREKLAREKTELSE